MLVRHEESSKNIADRFASENDSDILTAAGERDMAVLTSEILSFVEYLRVDIVEVYSSNSGRATATARPIAAALDCTLTSVNDLTSLVTPYTSGKTFAELLEQDARIAADLNLYRAGLFDSYRVKGVGEYSRQYEESISRVVDGIVKRSADLFIIVAHRSVITSELIAIARRSCNYPREFFGFVPVDFGASALASVDRGDRWQLHFANLPAAELNRIGRKLVAA